MRVCVRVSLHQAVLRSGQASQQPNTSCRVPYFNVRLCVCIFYAGLLRKVTSVRVCVRVSLHQAVLRSGQASQQPDSVPYMHVRA